MHPVRLCVQKVSQGHEPVHRARKALMRAVTRREDPPKPGLMNPCGEFSHFARALSSRLLAVSLVHARSCIADRASALGRFSTATPHYLPALVPLDAHGLPRPCSLSYVGKARMRFVLDTKRMHPQSKSG